MFVERLIRSSQVMLYRIGARRPGQVLVVGEPATLGNSLQAASNGGRDWQPAWRLDL
jgi:hypothetical protein